MFIKFHSGVCCCCCWSVWICSVSRGLWSEFSRLVLLQSLILCFEIKLPSYYYQRWSRIVFVLIEIVLCKGITCLKPLCTFLKGCTLGSEEVTAVFTLARSSACSQSGLASPKKQARSFRVGTLHRALELLASIPSCTIRSQSDLLQVNVCMMWTWLPCAGKS